MASAPASQRTSEPRPTNGLPTRPEYTAPAMRMPTTSTNALLRGSAAGALPRSRSRSCPHPRNARRRQRRPTFQVDPLWPKPLPNHWILGSVTGVSVDAQDHIWLVHRGMDSLTARTEAGIGDQPANRRSVLRSGSVRAGVRSGGHVVELVGWPRSGIRLAADTRGHHGGCERECLDRGDCNRPPPDSQEAPQPAPSDAHVLKFSRDGKFLLQIGHPGKIEGSFSKTTLNRPARLRLRSRCQRGLCRRRPGQPARGRLRQRDRRI